MMKKQILLSALASLILSGCGIYSKYHPVTEVPDNLYGEEAAVSDTSSIGILGWREIFTDPQLQDIIEQGLKQNTDLQSACLRVKEAEATLLSAKLAYLPSFARHRKGRQAVSTTRKRYRPICCRSLPVGLSISSAVSATRSVRPKRCWNRAVTIGRRYRYS